MNVQSSAMVDRPTSPPRRLRACLPCTKVKARCHFKEENIDRHVCERCDRMGIECSQKTTRSLRRPRQIKGGTRRSPGERRVISRTDNGGPAAPDETPPRHDTQGPVAIVRTVQSPSKPGHPGGGHQQMSQQPVTGGPLPPLGLSWDQVGRVLNVFRSRYMPVFPFVAVDQNISSQSLHEEKPFLLRAIMLVAAPLSVPRIAKMKRNVLAYMSQQVFVEERKSLDLLQGLLVCIAWAHSCQISDEQIVHLSHLALAHAHNLGVTNMPRQAGPAEGATKKDSFFALESSHSPDEQRALLGCFCLLSVTSAHTPRYNPLEGPYPEICRARLSTASSSPADLLIDRLVQLIQMGEKLSRGFGEPHERDQSRSYAFLLEGSGRRFRTELNCLAEFTAHPDLAEHDSLFQLYLQYLIVRLYEPAVTVADRPEDGVPPSRYRALCLHNCLGAVQTFLELVVAQPSDALLYRSIITSEQASFVMFIGARLLLIDAPDWNASLARQQFDLRLFLDKILAHVSGAEALRARAVEEFAMETGISMRDDGRQAESKLAAMAKTTTQLREWFEARLHGRQAEMEMNSGEVSTGGESSRQTRDEVSWSNGLLYGNGAWNFDP
ncbi:hypothetical protein B0T10DRAFT_5247 [Thelonectria olida]|uniref:Zn(2)-C6 fungal-type domain-containing protein n=1 Tax=Thelonectria olida TaxID=1576542 RepID=A0A9P8WI66_9HYPO|nr:hypothetical protein B0T10DRAFT_5247 [Thelonectria olida]